MPQGAETHISSQISGVAQKQKKNVAVPSPLLANYGLLDPPWDPERVHIGPGHTGGATIKASLDDLERETRTHKELGCY